MCSNLRKLLSLVLCTTILMPFGQSKASTNIPSERFMILGGPAVSTMILETLQKNKISVLNLSTDPSTQKYDLNTVDEEGFFKRVNQIKGAVPLMINSEFAQQIIAEKAGNSSSAEFASYFRDKAKFREWLKDLYPDFFFKKGTLSDFETLSEKDNISFPVIIKPATGYLSLCVYKVDSYEDLKAKIATIRDSVGQLEKEYPKAMLNCDTFIMEKFIDGDEVAVEGYYDASGKPVVLNIMARTFKDAADTSDIIYYTSKKVMQTYLPQVTELLTNMGKKTPFKSFPFIAELRIDTATNKLVPVELNPLRNSGNFIDELSFHAYGINNYDHFFNGKAPDWDAILAAQDDSVYGAFGAFFPENVRPEDVTSVKEDLLKKEFSEVLEFRNMLGGKSQCVYSILFYKAPNVAENERLIHLDLGQYINLK